MKAIDTFQSKKSIIRKDFVKTGDTYLIKKMGKEMLFAYRLYRASLEYGCQRDQVFCKFQFETLKKTLEILGRFHLTTNIHWNTSEV